MHAGGCRDRVNLPRRCVVKHAFPLLAVAVSLSVAGATARPPQGGDQAAKGASSLEVYHVHFNKAAPGQASALGDRLKTPDPKAPMPGHLLVLRHQEGDDWDYCVIEHLGRRRPSTRRRARSPRPCATRAPGTPTRSRPAPRGRSSLARWASKGPGHHRQPDLHRRGAARAARTPGSTRTVTSRPWREQGSHGQRRPAASRGRSVELPDADALQLVGRPRN